MKNYLRSLLFILAPLLLAACDNKRIYEQNADIPDNNWAVAFTPEFTFDISDTAQTYMVYFNVRNAISYDYYNLYVRHNLFGPDGKQLSSQLHELYLLDPKTGEPRGSGSGDLFDHRVLALRDVKFGKPGTYKLKLTQYMRRDPLPGIVSVGVRVEKAQP